MLTSYRRTLIINFVRTQGFRYRGNALCGIGVRRRGKGGFTVCFMSEGWGYRAPYCPGHYYWLTLGTPHPSPSLRGSGPLLDLLH